MALTKDHKDNRPLSEGERKEINHFANILVQVGTMVSASHDIYDLILAMDKSAEVLDQITDLPDLLDKILSKHKVGE